MSWRACILFGVGVLLLGQALPPPPPPYVLPDPLDAGTILASDVRVRGSLGVDGGLVVRGNFAGGGAATFAGEVQIPAVDAGTIRAESLGVGLLDAGTAYSNHVESTTAFAHALRVGVVDAGSIYVNYTEGDTSAWNKIRAGVVDAGFVRADLLHAGTLDAGAAWLADVFPIGSGTVRVWGEGVRAPQIGNVDGGFILRTGLGLSPTPAPFVPFCDGSTIPFGSLIYYNFQWWECSAALAALGATGSWAYMGQPPITYEARTPADPQGSATAAGVAFAARNSGTHYLKLAEMTVKVEFPGACTGGCTAGTNARYLIVQRNKQDGGYRELAKQQIPCVAPVGSCSMFAAPPSTGCASDGGAPLMALPVVEGGLVELEIQADGGQCTPPPIVSVTGFGFLLMQPDGGGA